MKAGSSGRAAIKAASFVLGAAWIAAVTSGCVGDDSSGGTSSSSSSSSSSGASSSSSGGGGSGGGGQGGSSGAPCVDPDAYAGLFSIEDKELCAVAVYTADADIATYESSPTWGAHGGLVTVAKGAAAGSIEVTRWTAPSGASGALKGAAKTIAAAIPVNFFVGAQAFDLPFLGWTALSWTAQFPDVGGEVLLVKGDAVDKRYDVNGFFSGVGVSAGGDGTGRLLYSGLSALEAPMDSKSGLYAADSCGSVASNPRLVPEGDATCAAPSDVSLWGEFSGPVAVDHAGNVFAVMTSFSTSDQEARGFEASTVARGAPKTTGVTLFKAAGSGTALAAIAPDASSGATGVLAFQPSDAATFAALDVIEQRYSVSAGAVKGEGNTGVLLKLTKPGTLLSMTSDDQDRLWVAGTDGASGTLIVVVARAPK